MEVMALGGLSPHQEEARFMSRTTLCAATAAALATIATRSTVRPSLRVRARSSLRAKLVPKVELAMKLLQASVDAGSLANPNKY